MNPLRQLRPQPRKISAGGKKTSHRSRRLTPRENGTPLIGATATTAASGRNREELLGQRPAGCKRQRSRRWEPQPGRKAPFLKEAPPERALGHGAEVGRTCEERERAGERGQRGHGLRQRPGAGAESQLCQGQRTGRVRPDQPVDGHRRQQEYLADAVRRVDNTHGAYTDADLGWRRCSAWPSAPANTAGSSAGPSPMRPSAR